MSGPSVNLVVNSCVSDRGFALEPTGHGPDSPSPESEKNGGSWCVEGVAFLAWRIADAPAAPALFLKAPCLVEHGFQSRVPIASVTRVSAAAAP